MAFPRAPRLAHLGSRFPEMAHSNSTYRRLAHLGAAYGPAWFVRLAPVAIGLLFALLLRNTRRVVFDNQRWLGARSAASAWWRTVLTFVSFAQCLTESLGSMRAEALRPRVYVRNAWQMEELLATGQGLIVLTAHVGPWDGAAQTLLTREGIRLMLVMAHEADADAERVHDDVRRDSGVLVTRIGHHPLEALPILQHLNEGGVVALQMDRVPRGADAVNAHLCGRTFPVPTGPFLLAGIARVPVVPALAVRTGYFACRIEVGEPIYPSRRPSVGELTQVAQAAVSQLENHLVRFPTQWFRFEAEEAPSAS